MLVAMTMAKKKFWPRNQTSHNKTMMVPNFTEQNKLWPRNAISNRINKTNIANINQKQNSNTMVPNQCKIKYIKPCQNAEKTKPDVLRHKY